MKTCLFFIVAVTLLASCTGSRETGNKESTAPVSVKIPEATDKGNVNYDEYFTDNTMRLDYFHSGSATEEHFALDRVVNDGPWPGSRKNLLDRLNLGLYFFEVKDRETNLLLYSRGFASIFGEWQTIPEATEVWGTFHESVRFPWPKKQVTVVIKKRDGQNNFVPIWSTDIDPESRQVNPAGPLYTHRVDVIVENGPPESKVDIVILGDGYSKNEMDKFRKDAERLSGSLLNTEPFRTRKTDFNIRAVETPAETTGVAKPHHRVYKRTPLSVHYSSFDSERYALTYDNRTVRDIASEVPYDMTVILINERTYGGGGIFNLYATVSAGNKFADYIMVHEMGHHMAALADEYYTSSVAYEVQEVKVEPWEKNITALFDKEALKWKHLVEEGIPVPTPWNKEEFDRHGYAIQKERDSLRKAMVPESVMEDLFIRQMKQEDELFKAEKYFDKGGAFEGAGYLPEGLYRSQIDCIMFTRHMKFCRVCRAAIEEVIDCYVK